MFNWLKKLLPHEHIPIIGHKYIIRSGDPFPSKNSVIATIIDIKMGWVRYHLNSSFPDKRMELKLFNIIYEPFLENK